MRQKLEESAWHDFLRLAEGAHAKKQIVPFLDVILGSNEKQIISRRLAALILLKEGKSYKEISRVLWISPATLSALKKSVYENKEYSSTRQYVTEKKVVARKKMRGLPERTIFDYWLNLPLPTKSGKGRWRFLNYQG